MLRDLSALVLTVSLGLPLHAQAPAAGSVHGEVKDQQGGVLPKAIVSATSATVPVVYRAATDARGAYRLVDLPPGEYDLVVERQGFTSVRRPSVSVRAGLSVAVNFEMAVGDVNETLEVRAETPLLEARSGTQAVNVSGDLLRSVPLSERREWYGSMAMTPGVVTAPSNVLAQVHVRGSSGSATVVQIDGADVTNAGKFGVGYLQLSTDVIEDIQIQTAAVNASAPLGFGGVVNIATASGTNRPRGAVGVYFQPRRWNDSNQPGGTSTAVNQKLFDLSYGGPVWRDHVWGFAAYRRTDITTGISRSAAQLAALRALVSGYEPLDNTNEAHFWFGKLTAQASPAHQFVGFYQKDVNPVWNIVSAGQYPYGEVGGGMAASFRVASVWSDWLTTRLGATYNNKRRELRLKDSNGPTVRVYSSTILSAGRLQGNGQLADIGTAANARQTQPSDKLTVTFDTTFYASHRAGTHEVQAGLFAQPRVQGTHLSYINGGFTLEEQTLRRPGVLESGTIPFHRLVLDGTELTILDQRTSDYAAYIQDSWQPSSRLTVSGGVRVDRIVTDDRVYGITSQRSVDVGPRLSANYSLTGDHRTIARGYWLRVHDQPGVLTTTGNPALGQRDLFDLNLDGTFETVYVTPATAGTIANRAIAPDLHQSFVQDWGAGVSRQLKGGIAANLDFVRRRFIDRPTLVETNARYEGGVFVGYADERFNNFLVAMNNRWNTPVYSSLELSLTKRTSHVQAIASYVRQWRHIDGTWQPGDPASLIQPDAFSNDKGIGSSTGSGTLDFDTNSLNGLSMTQNVWATNQWQDHVVRLAATWSGPWGLQLSTNYTFQSGVWSGPIVTRIAAPDPAFGPPTVRLSNGRVVTNPLATTLRFAYPTRSDGQQRTPAMHVWNLRIGRRSQIGRITLDAALDVFNVINNGADTSFQLFSNQTFNPFFGQTRNRQAPRSAQIALRASF